MKANAILNSGSSGMELYLWTSQSALFRTFVFGIWPYNTLYLILPKQCHFGVQSLAMAVAPSRLSYGMNKVKEGIQRSTWMNSFLSREMPVDDRRASPRPHSYH